MKVTFDHDELDAAVTPLTGVTSKNNTIASVEGIQIKATEDNICVLSGFDMEKGMRVTLNADVERAGCFVINAVKLSQIIKTMPQGRITVEVGARNITKIFSGKSEFQLQALDGSDFPNLPEFDGEQGFNIKRGEFAQMIKKSDFAVPANDPRAELNGLHIEISGKRIKMVSSDRNRIAMVERLCELENHGEGDINSSFTIPTKTLPELSRLLGNSEGTVSIKLGRKHIIFTCDNVVFFTRVLDKEFIDYKRFIPSGFAINVKLNGQRLLQGLERALLITENIQKGETKSPLRCNFNEDKLVLTTASSTGRFYDEMGIEKEGEDLEIGFNCRFLIEVIRACETGELSVSLNSPLMSMVIEPVVVDENNSYLYLILPLRLK
jgi:DNA polymerase III, beta subunit